MGIGLGTRLSKRWYSTTTRAAKRRSLQAWPRWSSVACLPARSPRSWKAIDAYSGEGEYIWRIGDEDPLGISELLQ